MSGWLPRLRYAWRRHGPIGFVRLAAYNVVHHILGRKRSADLDPFDATYGTETGSVREIGSLDIAASAAAAHAVRYEPSPSQLIQAEIDRLPIDHERFAFIDFGSGKGLALLVASGFPFKDVIGIEFSRELHEVAVQNIARLPPDIIRAGSVRSIHGDAASFEPPLCDLVCYFYNPFGPTVITPVVERLAQHHAQRGYRVFVIYVDPRHREVFEEIGAFAVLNETPHVVTLTTPARADGGERL